MNTRRKGIRAGKWLGGVVAVLGTGWWAIPPPVLPPLPPATALTATAGEWLATRTSPDGYWRWPVRRAQVDPRFMRALLAIEDQRFQAHPGVDPLALGRAIFQNGVAGRVVSGGSTLTQQTARLLQPAPRTLATKFRELGRAIQLERHLDKDAILALYLTLAPYGGNLQGLRAATRFYFGKEPESLSASEIALLIALPQAPEARRPDRHPAKARQARAQILARLAERGVLDPDEARVAAASPLPSHGHLPHEAPHLLVRQPRGAGIVATTLDADIQQRLRRLASQTQTNLGRGVTLSTLVVEHATGEIRAMMGSGDFHSRDFPGQVDMTRALRSPGSALKPFLYGQAFAAGWLHPETQVLDRYGPIAGYAAQNFDREYRGWISARQALQDSLNTPAVRILAALGPSRVEQWLNHTGIKLAMPPHASGASLPLALGGVGIRLTDLVSLYAALANEGRWQPLRVWAADPPGQGQTLLPAGAAWQVRDCLAGTPPPAGFSADAGVAFKTGTSYGFRDAWAVGFNGRYTVGVWVGRPDGGYAPDQTGRIQAAPLLFQIFALLSPADPAPGLPPSGTLLLTTAQLPPGLREFPARSATKVSASIDAPALLFPGPDTRLANGGVVEFKAQGGQPPLSWLLDGHLLADATWRRAQWAIDSPGTHRLTLVDATGRQTSRVFWVEPE